MEKVSAYKLSDGSLVEDREEATKLQATINFEKSVKNFADKYGSYFNEKNMIENVIIDNAAELYLILQKYNDECNLNS